MRESEIDTYKTQLRLAHETIQRFWSERDKLRDCLVGARWWLEQAYDRDCPTEGLMFAMIDAAIDGRSAPLPTREGDVMCQHSCQHSKP